ncbi:MAG: hypothetical protein WAN86_00035 [Hyphomicrobiaceae bacterium]
MEAARGAAHKTAWLNWDLGFLRSLVRSAGVGWSVLFVAVGLVYELQLYGDGSIFSYAIATQETWAFHWHNIPNRLFVHLLTHVPAETYVWLSGDAGGAIAIYGLLFFGAPLIGLAATYAADRSEGRVIFTFACLSTACLCPLVLGCPTETWIAHSAFWPAVAILLFARCDALGTGAVFLSLLALAFSHEAGLVLAASILTPLLLRGQRSFAFLRAAVAFLVVLGVWVAVRVLLPPDAYYASIVGRAAFLFMDVAALAQNPMLLLLAAVAAYLVLAAALRRIAPDLAHVLPIAIVAVGLAVYWLAFDSSMHAENRYTFRTALFAATAPLGILAGVLAQSAGRRSDPCPPRLVHLLALIGRHAPSGTAAGAVMLIALVHAVETAKYVSAWTDYKAAVRALAMGSLSDPRLGDPGFVSSQRIGRDLQALSWFSTTPYLSVLVAPRFQPRRLVVDPNDGYYWLSCETAAAHHQGNRAIPRESRRLVRVYSCLHRPPVR